MTGTRLGLREWTAIPVAVREDLAFGTFDESDTTPWTHRLLRAAFEGSNELAAAGTPDTERAWMHDELPTNVVQQAQELGLNISTRQWRALDELQRFALLKLSRPGHENRNFLAAMREFGIAP